MDVPVKMKHDKPASGVAFQYYVFMLVPHRMQLVPYTFFQPLNILSPLLDYINI